MTIVLDGQISDWTNDDLLGTAETMVNGYAIYGRIEEGSFLVALQSAVPIGPNTTFWLNTDGNTSTGHLVWDWAAGAEFNVNFGSDGIPRLYTGADGQTLVGPIEYALSSDGLVLEMKLPADLLGEGVESVAIFADVNNTVFLPSNFGTSGYVIAPKEPSSFDGVLSEWTDAERLDTPSNGIEGYELYGRIEAEQFVIALKSVEAIGTNTTFWINVDGDTGTGHQIWGWAGGAEFNVNIGTDGIARLYSGAAGETFVSDLDFKIGPDGTTLELAIPKSALGNGVEQITILADINDGVFLPTSYASGGYSLAPASASAFDGLLTEWTSDQRLDGVGTGVEGYELYGRIDPDDFVVALKSSATIHANTTFWINTDADISTGHKIWGWAGGAEFNVNIGTDGIARLYSGAAGETFVADLDFKIGPDGTTMELAIPKALLGTGIEQIAILADINDTVFLPSNYGFGGYTLAEPQPSAFDGLLTEWTNDQRLENPATSVGGYELYGKATDEAFVIALKSEIAIGPNTTFWLNTDGDASTGHLLWGWAVGAEFNVNIGADGQARLYSGAAGQTLVGTVDFAIGPDGKTLEMAIPKSLLGESVQTLKLMADVNDIVHLPVDYTYPPYEIRTGSIDPVAPSSQKVAIIYSESTAANYWSEMAYAQLVMAAQSQAMSAGVPFDLIGEADLTNVDLLSQYSALIFPSFRNVPENYADIAAALDTIINVFKVPVVTSGDFMTNAADGQSLPGNAYVRMEGLLGLKRLGGEEGADVSLVTAGTHEITSGYTNGSIRDYANIGTSYFSVSAGVEGSVIANQTVNGFEYPAVISTLTGGRNVHFATDGMLADNNLLGQAIDWVTQNYDGPKISLSMSRDTALVASRNDMDQSQETWDVDGGIYDALLPILEQWKADYNFVGSYYINVGLYGPDQETNWFVSSQYYNQLLAMGNEIGSHSYTHPSDTNLLLPDLVTQEILDQRIAGYAQLLDNPSVCFCPYCMRDDADQAVIDALASMSVAQINATLEAALTAPYPASLDPVSKAILEASFRFQFGASKHVIEDQLGIEVSGAAVPGMPESLETARQIIQFYDYLSGGASMIGAGYPGAFGYLSPQDAGKVYIAPNMSFDFTLMGWLGLTAEQARDKWIEEFNELSINSDLPIFVWPWHDYGPTRWDVEGNGTFSNYSLEMFTSFLDVAYAKGAEFVTLADLADRISTFEGTELSFQFSGDTIIATAAPQSAGLGTFAINLDSLGGQTIAYVANWYAYDGNSVFLDADGGAFEIKLGATQDDVTRIVSIGARIQLLSVQGNGTDLSFTMKGDGLVKVDLAELDGYEYVITGADIVQQDGDIVTLKLPSLGIHSVSVVSQVAANKSPTDIVVSNMVAVPENLLDRIKVADISVIDPDTVAAWRNNAVSVSDDRFEIDVVDGALYRKAGVAFDYETEPVISLTLSASDGEVTAYTKSIQVQVGNVNEAPIGSVVIKGQTIENQTLTANVSNLIDPDGLTSGFSYQWQRNSGGGFVDISGATAMTYILSDDDANAVIRVVASYVDGGGTLETVASAQTEPITDVLTPILLAPLTEDMTRRITAQDLVGPAYAGVAFVIEGLAVSRGELVADGVGAWFYRPALDDDTGVTFTYSVLTDQGSAMASATLDLVGMTDIKGTSGNDTLRGRSTADQYHGYAGNDTMYGGAGNDIFFGGTGNDRIYAEQGSDIAFGEDGDDIFFATSSDGNDTYDGGTGTDAINFSAISAAVTANLTLGVASSSATGTDTLIAIENVVGGSGSDTIVGSDVANALSGGQGNDRIEGVGGKDILTGGTGSDVFIFRDVSHTGPNAALRDVITDFVRGQDRIDVSGIDAKPGLAGDQAFSFLAGSGTAFTGAAGQLRFYFESTGGGASRTIIAGDVDGDGLADFSIELTGAISLTAADFIL